jgi:RHS repeat-associated protein
VKSLGTGTVKEHYYFNEDWQELEVRKETSGTISSNPFEQFVWHPYYIDALAARFYDSDVNTPTGVVQHYFTHDANFNVTSAVDTSGNVVERYDYSPYGEPIFLDANFDFDADSVSDIAHSRTYTGQRLDTETGLYQYRNRYYHAKLGRFISRDPIGYDGSQWNLYEYVGGRPTVARDPQGTGPSGRWIMCGGVSQWCPAGYGCYGGVIRRDPPKCSAIPCPPDNREPKPGVDPQKPNGCTSSPDSWEYDSGGQLYRVMAVECCNIHDECYQTCGTTQKVCDKSFGHCLRDRCEEMWKDMNKNHPWWDHSNPAGNYALCLATANAYESAVDHLGGAQSHHCQCKGR